MVVCHAASSHPFSNQIFVKVEGDLTGYPRYEKSWNRKSDLIRNFINHIYPKTNPIRKFALKGKSEILSDPKIKKCKKSEIRSDPKILKFSKIDIRSDPINFKML